ncbi:nitrogenase [Desulfuribacillus stibiiarsenatis]|uniref:Nitrogenase n=1 Tax=Desulfuribacillus stibiiarsenatis TaxID=1390249 RepID=A0A1E5L3I8_9FIRM|nr:nitrogenase component 1 [Desulfuribacillus stibiiarsenatis]OEH84641.1 nitrogenase [Desulfuribacillus stibiiarsenatis]
MKKTVTQHHKNVNENPCNMCMPMGGILPFKGIEGSMVIMHGSQGCSTYMRRHMAEHYNEPIDVGSSSLNEKGTVYGGEKNLKTGLQNIIKVYQPKLIGVLTTCLAETIGEDVERITADFKKEHSDLSAKIVPCATPGYGGTQFEGYFLTLKQILKHLTKPSESHDKINIIVPNISPADIREIKRILQVMEIAHTIFPDYSDTLDRPYERPYKKIPDGGTTIADIVKMSGAKATIQFAAMVDDELSPGLFLKEKYGIELHNIPIPTGLESTDIFLHTLSSISGKEIPQTIQQERGRLLDCMIDSHKYNAEGNAVIYGEPEQVYAITKACLENGIIPKVVATGSKTTKLKAALQPMIEQLDMGIEIVQETDFSVIRSLSVKHHVNLAIGHSDGRYLTEQEGIPLVRHGFPIHDRVGGQRLLSVGYTGTTMLLDRLTNTLLENKYNQYRTKMYKEYYEKNFLIGS